MKVGIVCSSGGHLTEALLMYDAFREHEVFICTYHSSMNPDAESIAPVYYFNNYFSQNQFKNVFYMAIMTFWSMKVILKTKPDALVSYGSEIALPFFYIGKLFNIKTIFIEPWSTVENLSLTGKLVYPIADEFVVQWSDLLEKHPKAKFFGGIV